MGLPLIIEVAVNGAVAKARNPHVPVSPEELCGSIAACVAAGASIVHVHADAPVVGGAAPHAHDAYLEVFRGALQRSPEVLLYPTLPGGAPGLTLPRRYGHITALREAGLLRIAPIDPGTMNYGMRREDGRPPVHDAVYANTFADVDLAFRYCSMHALGCTMSIFEPGFLQLVLAHHAAGSLPAASIVKLEFAGGRRLFGLPPTRASLEAYLAMLQGTGLPWMAVVRDGDLAATIGALVVKRGGHVRVGIEDYGGARTPRNEELVEGIAALGRRAGRAPASPAEAAAILGLARATAGSAL